MQANLATDEHGFLTEYRPHPDGSGKSQYRHGWDQGDFMLVEKVWHDYEGGSYRGSDGQVHFYGENREAI